MVEDDWHCEREAGRGLLTKKQSREYSGLQVWLSNLNKVKVATFYILKVFLFCPFPVLKEEHLSGLWLVECCILSRLRLKGSVPDASGSLGWNCPVSYMAWRAWTDEQECWLPGQSTHSQHSRGSHKWDGLRVQLGAESLTGLHLTVCWHQCELRVVAMKDWTVLFWSLGQPPCWLQVCTTLPTWGEVLLML